MDLKQRLPSFLARLHAFISERVHDRHLQTRLQFGSALGLGVGLVMAATIFSGILGTAPARLSDFLYQSPAPTGQVVIVAIDDSSLKEIGNLPWPRATIAALVDAIAQAQPHVIGLDLVMPEPASGDPALAETLARVPNLIQPIIGVEATQYPLSDSIFPRFDIALAPAPTLRTASTRLAHTMIPIDTDGTVRRLPLAIETGGRRYNAFGIAALEVFLNQTLGQEIENGYLSFGTQRLPVDAHGQMEVNFVGSARQHVIPAVDVLRNRINLSILRDKIVLIGTTGSAMPENFRTPLAESRRAYAIEIQANLIETILGNHLLSQQDELTEIVMVFLLAILAGVTLTHFRLLTALALTIIYFLMYLGYAFSMFNVGVVVQPLYPIVALLLSFLGAMVFRYFAEERRHDFILHLFRRYVAPDAVDRVIRGFDAGALPLGGITREVTVLCVDLSAFVEHASALGPEDLISLFGQHTAVIDAAIFRRGGSITQHAGETITAMWNLLLDQPNHAHAALHTALEIKRGVAELNQKRTNAHPIKVGIGVATGSVIAGRIGSAASAEYATLGDIIPLAERLAGKAERGLFINAETFARVKDEFETREVKSIKLRRKLEPLPVFQVLVPTENTEEPVEEDSGQLVEEI